PDDDLAVIGSGPCVPDENRAQDIQSILQRANLMSRIPQAYRDYLTAVVRGTIPDTPTQMHPAFAHVTAKVIGNTKVAVNGAAQRAREKGFTVEIADERLSGEAARAGETIARQLVAARAAGVEKRCFVWGGETTVTLGDSADVSGGGRCQELALAAARTLHDAGDGAARISLLAAGTDGRDGATDAAGAVVDASTWDAINATGRDPAHALAVHESHGALRAASALIGRRDTGTNVNDVVIGLV
ncbi:MAG TPA: MOFRL family protein, partial [Gemmatimonadaceae bacterium]